MEHVFAMYTSTYHFFHAVDICGRTWRENICEQHACADGTLLTQRATVGHDFEGAVGAIHFRLILPMMTCNTNRRKDEKDCCDQVHSLKE